MIKLDSSQVEKFINKELERNKYLLGINIGTYDGNLIAHNYISKSILSETEVSSYTSSMMNLSSSLLLNTLKREINYSLIKGKDLIVLSIRRYSFIIIAFIKREIEKENKIDDLIQDLDNLAIKIKTLSEIPEIEMENMFSLIKKSIPLTIWIAIVTKDGLPIQIESNERDAVIAGKLAHLFATSNLLIQSDSEVVIINGQEGHILISEIDENRILAVGILEENKEKVEVYISKIKEIIEFSKQK